MTLLICAVDASGNTVAELVADKVDVEREALRDLDISRALGVLTPRLRFIVDQHYIGGRSFNVIAQALGISESRVCQLNGKALETMQAVIS